MNPGRAHIKGVPHKFAISGCFGVYDFFCNYLKLIKNKPKRFKLDHKQYSAILHMMHGLVKESLLEDGKFEFPYKLGILRLVKRDFTGAVFKDGKLKIYKPCDPTETLKLWQEDDEARVNRYKIYRDQNSYLKFRLIKDPKSYKHQRYYDFRLQDNLQNEFRDKLKNNELHNYYNK
jgi:hypothetical protein